MSFIFYYETKIGKIAIVEENQKITAISFEKQEGSTVKETKLIKDTYKQIEEYMQKKRSSFSVPIQLKGTEFQKKVWEALQTIPYGETRSYKEVAEQIGNPKASRVVGMANHNNPIAIIVPCHRVIGKNGKLVGYAGGLDKKEILLEIERK